MSTVDSIIATETVTTSPTTDLDAANLQGAGPSGEDIFRERVQVTGELLAQIAKVWDQNPGPSDMGLVVRPVDQNTVIDLLGRILSSNKRIETYLAAMSDEMISDDDTNNNEGV